MKSLEQAVNHALRFGWPQDPFVFAERLLVELAIHQLAQKRTIGRQGDERMERARLFDVLVKAAAAAGPEARAATLAVVKTLRDEWTLSDDDGLRAAASQLTSLLLEGSGIESP